MKKLLFILLACLPLFGMAKDKKDNSDPKYLAGAITMEDGKVTFNHEICLLYTSPSPRDRSLSRMPSSA